MAVVLATTAPVALGVSVDANIAIGSEDVLCALAALLLSAYG